MGKKVRGRGHFWTKKYNQRWVVKNDESCRNQKSKPSGSSSKDARSNNIRSNISDSILRGFCTERPSQRQLDETLDFFYAVTRPSQRQPEEIETLDYLITDEEALLCALSIPQDFVPTPHSDFVKELNQLDKDNKSDYSVASDTIVEETTLISRDSPVQNEIVKGTEPVAIEQQPLAPATETETLTSMDSSVQNETIKRTEPVAIEQPLALVTDRKLRSVFAKYKKWDEAERSELEKLGDNKIKVNGEFVIEIDYLNYTKEEDVILLMDEDRKTCKMPPLPLPTAPNCHAFPCRYGCICQSINHAPIPRSHCGKPDCFFECTCQQTVSSSGDDSSDIKSRLRPRASLLNWRHMEPTGRKKATLANYLQLNRGTTAGPRMRRVAVAPQRYDEYDMSRRDEFKSTKEKIRNSVASLKFIRKQPATTRSGVKRRGRKRLYSSSSTYAEKAKATNAKLKESLPSKINETNPCKPSTVTICQLTTEKPQSPTVVLNEQTPVVQAKNVQPKLAVPAKNVQPKLVVPNLIQKMVEDGQVLLMGQGGVCFFAWTLDSRTPKAVIYDSIDGDYTPVPWLYLPIPPPDEAWLFHRVSSALSHTEFTYIPEVNCVLPSKALQMHLNIAHTKKKGVVLKIQWVGEDTMTRTGSIYIFPEVPGVLVCGPFPKAQIRPRGSSKILNASNLNSHLETLTNQRYMGDISSWNSVLANGPHLAYNAVRENVLREKAVLQAVEAVMEEDTIPEDDFMSMVPDSFDPTSIQGSSSFTCLPLQRGASRVGNLKVSWADAAELMSAPSSMP